MRIIEDLEAYSKEPNLNKIKPTRRHSDENITREEYLKWAEKYGSKSKTKPSKKGTNDIDELINKVESKLSTKKVKNLINNVESKIKKNKIKKDINELITTETKTRKKSKTSPLSKTINLVDDIINAPKLKKYKPILSEITDAIEDVDKLLKAKPKALKKLVKADKVHLKYHPSEQDKKEAKIDEASLLLSPYKYTNKPLIEQIADSMKQYPEFDTINKKKIKAYSYDVVKKFDKKYHDLMLRLFKTEASITRLLQKKADNIEKKVISEEKKTKRVKGYQEKAKEERKEKKKKKYKHFDDMTDVELKKYKQALNYYMRKSKESDILPKGLNKSDKEGLTNVCKELAEVGFDTMSEALFMKYYEG